MPKRPTRRPGWPTFQSSHRPTITLSSTAAADYERHQSIFNTNLYVTGSLGWLCVWLSIPGAFNVWLALVDVYRLLLASFAIAASLGYRGPVAEREWWTDFFRTSGWLVMSGVLSIVFYLAVLFVWVVPRVGVKQFRVDAVRERAGYSFKR
jgi:hypothetical protein